MTFQLCLPGGAELEHSDLEFVRVQGNKIVVVEAGSVADT